MKKKTKKIFKKMKSTEGSYRVCRICLKPEEGRVKFLDIFECNARIATKIFNIAGILMVNVDRDIPSLVCQNCVDDIEAAESLKLRILDADEYFSMMTREKEINFLKVDVKALIESNLSTPKVKVKRISLNENAENGNPRKRKLVTEYDENLEANEQKKLTPKVPKNTFKSKATPNKLGIERMIIKSQKSLENSFVSAKSKIAAFFKPAAALPKRPSSSKKMSSKLEPAKKSSSAKRKPFALKLIVNRSSKSRGRSSSEPRQSQISFECDTCQDTFESSEGLNEHISTHAKDEPESSSVTCASCDEAFPDSECFDVHRRTCKLDGTAMKTLEVQD